MCDGTVLPHCGHLLECGARQRLAAFRIRNRILDVLRFGTPMQAFTEARSCEKTIANLDQLHKSTTVKPSFENPGNRISI
jgi:hypothetical protein